MTKEFNNSMGLLAPLTDIVLGHSIHPCKIIRAIDNRAIDNKNAACRFVELDM